MAPARMEKGKDNPGGSDIARQIEAIAPKLPDKEMTELRNIWLNALRLTERAGPDDLFHLMAFIEQIEAEWEKRGATSAIAPDEYFRWPSTETSPRRHVVSVGEEEEPISGMLAYLEYHVGRTEGQPPGIRHAILDRVFSGSLPPVFDKDYLAQWGSPGTARRLQKLAETLAARVRSFKRRRDETLEDAIRDWEADLDFLHDKYYVDKFGFAWPATKTR